MADVVSDDALERALRDLARHLEGNLDSGAPSDQLVNAVLARVAGVPAPAPSRVRHGIAALVSWSRARSRWVLGLVLALLLTGVAVSPVGAEVAGWFGFHGVRVSIDDEAPTGEPTVPVAEGGLTLDQAAAAVGFRPVVPAFLGPPEAVAVSTDQRLLSMSWSWGAGTIRLDQFDAALAPLFWKTANEAELVPVGPGEGLWFPTPHEVVVLGDSGEEVSVAPRLAARTLVWPVGNRTFRLEGDLTRARALQVARSLR